MVEMDLIDSLKDYKKILHELQFRDKVKSAEYHYQINFEFDGFFEEELVKNLFNKIVEISKEIEYSTFKLGVCWPSDLSDFQKSHLKYSVQSELIKKIQIDLNKTPDFDNNSDLEFLIDFLKKIVFLRIRPVYVIGNYNKFSREIAQTEYFCNKCRGVGCWYCNDTGHFSDKSVEQLITPVFLNAFKSKLLILHGAGREDLDVLMLGKGRPFVVELLIPKKRTLDLKLIESKIKLSNKGVVKLNSLSFCKLEDVSKVKDELHGKIYTAFIESNKEVDLNDLVINKDILVSQYTPKRVEGRRVKMERQKKVVIFDAFKVSNKEFVLTLKTSHGTYVKEFVSSDGGRTNPSISSMLKTNCSCVLLDVEEIC